MIFQQFFITLQPSQVHKMYANTIIWNKETKNKNNLINKNQNISKTNSLIIHVFA